MRSSRTADKCIKSLILEQHRINLNYSDPPFLEFCLFGFLNAYGHKLCLAGLACLIFKIHVAVVAHKGLDPKTILFMTPLRVLRNGMIKLWLQYCDFPLSV